jgi:hypothetical protein
MIFVDPDGKEVELSPGFRSSIDGGIVQFRIAWSALMASTAGQKVFAELNDKPRTNSLCGLLIALFSLSPMHTSAADPAISDLKVTVISAVSEKGQTLTLWIGLLNEGEESVVIPDVFIVGGTVWIELYDAAGKASVFLGQLVTMKSLGRKQFVELQPSRSIGAQIRIDDGSFRIDPDHDYTVAVQFVNSDSGSRYGLRSWTGELASEQQPITIIDTSRGK